MVMIKTKTQLVTVVMVMTTRYDVIILIENSIFQKVGCFSCFEVYYEYSRIVNGTFKQQT